ncbi:MAG: hypothetical protein IKS55_00870 [Oscillospiraceae bacterium]|nr:hypothetical protein [Oscillospiraceae bacterium]
MKNKVSSITTSILFVVLLIVPTLLYFSVGENTENALNEKRELTELPVKLSNDYFAQLGSWYNDHAPYRITLITLQKKINQSYSATYRNKIHPLLSELFAPSWYKTAEYQKRTAGGLPYLAPIEESNVAYGRDNWLFYLGDNSVGYYNGTNLLSEEEKKERQTAFQELNNLCEKKGIKLVVFAAPNKEQVYSENMPSYYVYSEEKRELQFREFMKDSGVIFLYPLEELISGKEYYDTYYQQDTHWNYVGAYIGVSEIYKALNMPFFPIQEIEIEKTEKTGGDLSNFCGYKTDYEDYKVEYKPEITVSSESFENGNLEIYESSVPNNRKLVMISDSFRSASKGFLTKDFSKSIILHQKMLENEMTMNAVKELSDGDVLLLLRVERYDNGLFSCAKRLVEVFEEDDNIELNLA